MFVYVYVCIYTGLEIIIIKSDSQLGYSVLAKNLRITFQID